MTSNSLRAREIARQEKRDKWEKGVGIANAVTGGIGSIGRAAGSVLNAINDPSWYNLDPQLVKDSASISFHTPLGSIMDRNTSSNYAGASDPSEFRAPYKKAGIPGTMVLWFTPTVGISESGASVTTSAVNVAAKNVYAYVRHANSGSANYESPDLLMYLLAMDSAYMLVTSAARLYSIALTAKGANRYYPKMNLMNLGMTADGADELIENLATFRLRLNSYVTRLGAFYVPNTMPVIVRHQWMVSNIFKDSEVKKSQEYMFAPRYYYVYNEINNLLIGTLTNFRTISDIYFMLDNVLNPLIESESIGIMSGDILKAYGPNGVVTVTNYPEDYHIESTYSMEVLSQISNATPVGYLSIAEQGQYNEGDIQISLNKSGWSSDPTKWVPAIVQNTNGQVFSATVNIADGVPQVESAPGVYTLGVIKNWGIDDDYRKAGYTTFQPVINLRKQLINMYKDDPTPDDVMVASRLTAVLDANWYTKDGDVHYLDGAAICQANDSLGGYESHGALLFAIETCGTEIVNVVQTLYPAISNVDGTPVYQGQTFYDLDPRGIVSIVDSDTGNPNFPAIINSDRLDILQKFDWCPRIRLAAYYKPDQPATASDQGNCYIIYDSADFANFAIVEAETLENMHYVATISEYGVPLIGTKRR